MFSTPGNAQYIRGYLEYIGGCSVHGKNSMIHVRDIMSTSEDGTDRGDIMILVGKQTDKSL